MRRLTKIILLIITLVGGDVMSQEDKDSDYLFQLSMEELLNVEVTTASRQSESFLKTPVPITVITRRMIDVIGARNIKELLTTYVPGMTSVEDHNEMNISMRGVYTSSQQKILFLLNGHRLNSRAYSMANPDYGINLDRVKQIEVLRGPGSSLYGNVSLTAVVNIITIEGGEFDGTQLKLLTGNNKQFYVGGVSGVGLGSNKDVLAWGHFYQADGEERKLSATSDYSSNTTEDGVAYLGGAQSNYDVGVQAQLGKFDFLFNSRKGKIQQPFSDGGGTGEFYDEDDYEDILGEEPGTGQEMQHLKIGYSSSIGKSIEFELDVYADKSNLVSNHIASPLTAGNLAVFWWDRDAGGIAQFTYQYNKGNVLLGAQVDWMSVYDSYFAASVNIPGVLDTYLDTTIPLLEQGEEIIYSGFTQWKHFIRDNVIINSGLRYDNKKRHEGKNIMAISPRFALIVEASKNQNIKFSFGKSFVDAPYWYRYNSLASYSGSRNLKPENLYAIQLTLDSRMFDSKLMNNFNAYYQSVTDIIFRDPNAQPTDPHYQNAGHLNSWGIEEQVTYKVGHFDLNINATYQHVIYAKDYSVNGKNVANVPRFTSNLIGTYHITDNVFVNMVAKYISSQFSPVTALGNDVSIPDYYVDQAIVLNAGVNAAIKDLVLDLRVRNLTDTRYYQGGSTRYAYPQEGRWITASIMYKFKNKE